MKTIMIITTAIGAAILPITMNSCATAPTTQSSVKPYLSDKCIVTDNKLGSMGDPVTKVYNEQEVKFCCAPCIKKFEKEPNKYLAKIK